MFDSQNNNRGGYNVGKMQMYQGEKVPITWTNQHGSSKYQMENTEFVLQYMCEPLLRDGTTTATIPDKPIACQNFDCDTDVRYGRHESFNFYELCKTTERNKGLFTANQNLKGNSAKYTRQNPNGNRHAYECPEERDYYPYWRPSPWKDIAYITNDIEKCEKITAESQNVKPRGYCTLPAAYYQTEFAKKSQNLPQNSLYPIDANKCGEWSVKVGQNGNITEFAGVWKEVPAWEIAKPKCVQTEQTRANHLGLVGGRTDYTYEWTIPDEIGEQSRCTTRVRYNITTGDYTAWEEPASLNAGVNQTWNKIGKHGGNANQVPAQLDMWSKFGLSKAENLNGESKLVKANSREYVLLNNPQVELLKPTDGNGNYQSDDVFPGNFRFKLQLAVNTAQFGRTFQDRCHAFSLRARPEGACKDADMQLITVTGKRGNIVQTFPATEYKMLPDRANVQKGTCVHWAWTGSNTNPNHNDGQGKQGTDRSNVCPMRVDRYDKDLYSNFWWDTEWKAKNQAPIAQMGETGDIGASYPAFVKEPEGYSLPDMVFGQNRKSTYPNDGAITNAEGTKQQLMFKDNLLKGALGGMDEEFLSQLCTSRQSTEHDFGNMEELDDASTSVDMEPVPVTAEGCWNYVSTRNNNFSNRSQKGKLCVTPGSVTNQMVGENGGSVRSALGDWIEIPPGSVTGLQNIKFESWREKDAHVLMVSNLNMKADEKFMAALYYEPKALHTPRVVHCPEDTENCSDQWKDVDEGVIDWKEKDGGNYATLWSNEGGQYTVVHDTNVPAVAAIAIGSMVFVCALVAVIYFRWRSKNKMANEVNMQGSKI